MEFMSGRDSQKKFFSSILQYSTSQDPLHNSLIKTEISPFIISNMIYLLLTFVYFLSRVLNF